MTTKTSGQLKTLAKPPAMETIDLQVDASGDLSTTMGPFTGYIDSFFFDKGTLADTVDITVTVTRTGQQVWAKSNMTADAIARPRITPQGTDGADLSALTVLEKVFLFDDELTVVVDEGGNATLGALSAIIV